MNMRIRDLFWKTKIESFRASQAPYEDGYEVGITALITISYELKVARRLELPH